MQTLLLAVIGDWHRQTGDGVAVDLVPTFSMVSRSWPSSTPANAPSPASVGEPEGLNARRAHDAPEFVRL
ncbi:MAG: hypothetical protein IPM24_16845 [Bryobacterales bacterium]|nr:hypothetical protein [Bryobacterales bacterium]